MKPVAITSAAERELLLAGEYHELSRPHLREKLFQRVEHGLAAISENPKMCAEIHPGIRQYALRGFPYSLIYHELPDEVLVVAIAHHKRRAKYWLDRI